MKSENHCQVNVTMSFCVCACVCFLFKPLFLAFFQMHFRSGQLFERKKEVNFVCVINVCVWWYVFACTCMCLHVPGSVLFDCVCVHMSVFVQMMESLKVVPEEQRKIIAEAASVHRDQLRQRLLDDTTAVSQCVLRDFDWQLKVKISVLPFKKKKILIVYYCRIGSWPGTIYIWRVKVARKWLYTVVVLLLLFFENSEH